MLDEIKMIIGNERFDDTKILIDIDDKLAAEVTLKNVVININFMQYKKWWMLFRGSISTMKIGRVGKMLVRSGEIRVNSE